MSPSPSTSESSSDSSIKFFLGLFLCFGLLVFPLASFTLETVVFVIGVVTPDPEPSLLGL